jgi:6,7-dimethyl-8-ribityllumazine synthase
MVRRCASGSFGRDGTTAAHVTNLCNGCVQALRDCKVDEENIFQATMPGAFELPMAARFLALLGTVDAIVYIGVLIKGKTMHFEYIGDAIMNIGLQTSTLVIFGRPDVSQRKASRGAQQR